MIRCLWMVVFLMVASCGDDGASLCSGDNDCPWGTYCHLETGECLPYPDGGGEDLRPTMDLTDRDEAEDSLHDRHPRPDSAPDLPLEGPLDLPLEGGLDLPLEGPLDLPLEGGLADLAGIDGPDREGDDDIGPDDGRDEPPAPEILCNDGADNDGDGLADCLDPDCLNDPACTIREGDSCRSPLDLPLPGPASAQTTELSHDDEGSCGGQGRDIVYRLEIAALSNVHLDTLDSDFDTLIYVRQEDCLTGTELGCNDDSHGGAQSSLDLAEVPPGILFIFVDGRGPDDQGFSVLAVEVSPLETCEPLETRPCPLQTGVCLGSAQECNHEGEWGPCDYGDHYQAEEASCDDGRDNDCDEEVDCLDGACEGQVCDGLGRACQGGACLCPGGLGPEVACGDNADNDCDGFTDCQDVDCAPTPACLGAEVCHDGVDNNNDGLTDCQDPDCEGLSCGDHGLACLGGDCVCSGDEAEEISCDDGVDNDCNGLWDCLDPLCQGQACGLNGLVCMNQACLCPGGELIEFSCHDGLDNDCSGRSDCRDPNCQGQSCGPHGLTCLTGDCLCPGGLTEVNCDDGADNDCDGSSDCLDPDCGGQPPCLTDPEACDDGLDNDGDSLVDCLDPDCQGLICGSHGLICQSNLCLCPGGEPNEATCGDNQDNDCDGHIDCQDTDCASIPPCVDAEICHDLLDNDRDGLADCLDPDCHGLPCADHGWLCGEGACLCPGGEASESSCTDGADNDCDGLADCADPDCAGAPCGANGRACQGGTCSCPGGQTIENVCDDGLDNDCDGQADCLDDNCNNLVCGPHGLFCMGSSCMCLAGEESESLCDDGEDNDCDGVTDCQDGDCQSLVCGPHGQICQGADCLCPWGEESEISCADGVDNDCDGLVDCTDASCSGAACGGHGRVCQNNSCLCPGGQVSESNCGDGLDNDCDGLADCDDSSCTGLICGSSGLICQGGACVCPGTEPSEATCHDGVDNDCNGLVDCADSECEGRPCGQIGWTCQGGSCACEGGEAVEVTCDGLDNDCDGLVDEDCVCPSVIVPSGTFTRGNTIYGDADEDPEMEVYVSAFEIMTHEVTNAEYRECVATTICLPPYADSSVTRDDYFTNPAYNDHPVINVTWEQAYTYCSWHDWRLPTAAEWEKAARGSQDTRPFPWGGERTSQSPYATGIDCSRANYQDACLGDTKAVCSHETGRSPYGAYDMSGNVWEWVKDNYDQFYYVCCSNPSLSFCSTVPGYYDSCDSDPQGPSSGGAKEIRGGNFTYGPEYARVTDRYQSTMSLANPLLGFRCVRDIP